jgi:predicted GNAT family acetyltransferase
MTEFVKEKNAVYYKEDGQTLAEIHFPEVGQGVVDITQTRVDDSLAGQGIAGQLALLAAQSIRDGGLKTRTTCTYAEKWFAKHPEFAELLEK